MACFHPYYDRFEKVMRPCGYCSGCLRKKANDWKVRLAHEIQLSEQVTFLTLTYDDKNLPQDKSVDKDAFVKYVKRLRSRLKRRKHKGITYFGCGEYGDKTARPHYHIILFGISAQHYRELFCKQEQSDRWIKDTLWTDGFTRPEDVRSPVRASSYVSNYLVKSFRSLKRVKVRKSDGNGFSYEWRRKDGRKLPFIKYSNGLGAKWLDTIDAQTAKREGYVVLGGSKYSVPRYYRERWERDMSIYDIQLSKLDRLGYSVEMLKEDGYLRKDFDFRKFKALAIRVGQADWISRDHSIELELKKKRQRINNMSIKAAKQLFYEFRYFVRKFPDYSCLAKYIRKNWTEHVDIMEHWYGFNKFVEEMVSYSEARERYSCSINDRHDNLVFIDLSRFPCVQDEVQYILWSNEIASAKYRKFIQEKENRIQADKNLRAKWNSEKCRGVL